jgi:hypothetical protein
MAVLGAAAGGAFPQLTITQSQTWVPPQDGNVCIHVVGAGGGGRGASNACHSGGAGAYGKIPTLAVTTSGSFTLVVGNGGAVGTGAGGASGNGGAGGSSSISGTGLTGTKTCGGGGPGINASNGAGGSVSGSGESWAGYSGGAGVSNGGGAVGIYATGQAGQGTYADNAGGMTDAQSGGLAMSGYGIICGGSQPSVSQYLMTGYKNYPIQGDDLCGGGAVEYSNTNGWMYSASGGIGGGGGGCRGASVANVYAGAGGDGIILIQYLPW